VAGRSALALAVLASLAALPGCGGKEDADEGGGASASGGSGAGGGLSSGGVGGAAANELGGSDAGGSGGSGASTSGGIGGVAGQTGGSGGTGASGSGGLDSGGTGGSGAHTSGGTAGLAGQSAGGDGGFGAQASGGASAVAGQSGGGNGGSGNDAGAGGTDPGVLVPPGPGISCGDATCDEDSETCCIDDSSISCGPFCSGGVIRLECDDSLDCPDEVCCFVNALESALTATHCAADCGDYAVEVCNEVGDCTNGESCRVYTCSHPSNPAASHTLGLCTTTELMFCE